MALVFAGAAPLDPRDKPGGDEGEWERRGGDGAHASSRALRVLPGMRGEGVRMVLLVMPGLVPGIQ